MPPVRLIGYTRVSRVKGRSGASFQSLVEQRKAIEHIVALTPGTEVVEWIEDLDESGRTMNRPGAKRAIEAVDNGSVDGVAMAYLSRWARTPSALEKIEQWAREGKVFLSAAERMDTTTSHGMFALGVLLLVAKLELDRHVEQWEITTRNAVERGVAIRVPYGYRRSENGRLAVDEPAASVVRKMFRLRASGQGSNAIAATLDADGIPPPMATHWTRQTVRAMLRVQTYRGIAQYGAHATTDAHPALVDDDTWRAAQTVRGPSRQHGQNLLASILRCAGCGYLMGGGSGGGGRRYSCNRVHGGGRCPSPTTAMASRLEEYVAEQFLAHYGPSAVARAADLNPELVALERTLEQARHEFETWRDDTGSRRMIGDEHYRAGLVRRHTELSAAERAHTAAVREASAHSLAIDAAVWEDMTIPERRLLLSAGIDDVLLSRAARTSTPIADRCVIRWTGQGTSDLPLPRQGVAGPALG